MADGSIFAVADGVGGTGGGEIAAEMAVAELARCPRPSNLRELIARTRNIHKFVRDTALLDDSEYGADGECRDMATTLCVLAKLRSGVRGGAALGVANVGDSRLYALTPAGLRQITLDHSGAGEKIRAGKLKPERARQDPDYHMVTRVIGYYRHMNPDAWELRAVPGTRFLICSDGVSNEVSDAKIAEALRDNPDPGEAAAALIAASSRNYFSEEEEAAGSWDEDEDDDWDEEEFDQGGGWDNATAVVVDVIAVDAQAAPDGDGDLVDDVQITEHVPPPYLF